MSPKPKLTLLIALVALVSVLLVGGVAWSQARTSMQDQQFENLTSLRSNKARLIENYFESVNGQMRVYSEDLNFVAAMVELNRGFAALEDIEIPIDYDTSIDTYYEQEFLPALENNITSGSPDLAIFKPAAQPTRYLQYHYISNNGSAVGFKHFLDDAGDGSAYSEAHKKYHPGLRELTLQFGYYDLFLINLSGEIVYSVYKEVDFGTNLNSGQYRNSGLASMASRAISVPVRAQVNLVDFQPYAPSYNAPAAFASIPIFNGPHPIGVVAIQLPVDQIDSIMTSEQQWRSEGMAETGETYIVGPENLMRSNARQLIEDRDAFLEGRRAGGTSQRVTDLIAEFDSTILLQTVSTEATRAAHGGETDTRVTTDYDGTEVLSSFGPLEIDGLDWVLVSEIDSDEAFASVRRLLRAIVIAAAIFIPAVAIMSIWLARWFMRPVRGLIDTTTAISEDLAQHDGELGDVRFDDTQRGEFGELAGSLNRVADSIQRRALAAGDKHDQYVELLGRTMPASVADRYENGEEEIIDLAENAVITYISITGVRLDEAESEGAMATSYAAMIAEIKHHAHALGVDFFDNIGPAFIGVCGLTTPYLNAADRSLRFGDRCNAVVGDFNLTHNTDLLVQVGIDSGPMQGTLVAHDRSSYSLWGEVIVSASKLATEADPGVVAVSQSVRDLASLTRTDVDVRSLQANTTEAL